MIVATAGHIDHGKTSLVRALTGIDADRLPEEKRRGMTIDIGFAYMPLAGGEVLGFVDVPGHERFVRNMLAGVSGIDLGLLVVAADDGPMPQTREHVAILDLLGVPAGVVALTKTDRVPAERRAEVEAEIRELLAATAFVEAPIFPVSSVTGEGVAELRAHLERRAGRAAAHDARGGFRLAVDRAFLLRGAGLVVTGTVFAGSVKIGDRLVLSPNGDEVRVRSLHAQNREAHAGRAGQRCAVAIAGTGVGKERVHRGDWLVAPALHAPTRRLDARLRVLADESPIKDRAAVHLHLGAADVTARVALLEGRPIAAGETGLVQLILDREIAALAGDRFVVRDPSATRTIGGGRVIDPFPPARGRRTPERLAALASLERPDDAAALAALVESAPNGVDLARFALARNIGPAELATLAKRVGFVRAGPQDRPLAIAPARWQALEAAILAAVRDWHAREPASPGLDEERLRRMLPGRPSAALATAVVRSLVTGGRLVRQSGMLRDPGHRAALTPDEATLWVRVEPLLVGGGLRPPRVREVAEVLGLPDHRPVEQLLRKLAALGIVAGVADNRFYPPAALAELARIAEAMAKEAPDGRFTAAAFKDRSGIGRNVTISLLEYLDRVGFTRRVGEARIVLKPAAEAFPTRDA